MKQLGLGFGGSAPRAAQAGPVVVSTAVIPPSIPSEVSERSAVRGGYVVRRRDVRGVYLSGGLAWSSRVGDACLYTEDAAGRAVEQCGALRLWVEVVAV